MRIKRKRSPDLHLGSTCSSIPSAVRVFTTFVLGGSERIRERHFYRNPRNVEENCFVAISSPSSNVYASVRDVGTPEETAEKILKQTLIELASTRLGIIRESEVVSAKEDLDKDGTAFYDITLRIKSYAAKNQYGLTPEDRPQALEWDRAFYSRVRDGERKAVRVEDAIAFGGV